MPERTVGAQWFMLEGSFLFYWTYAWLDCSVHEVEVFFVNRQSDREGDEYYARRQTWGGLEERQLDDERQMEAEMGILERIGLE